MAKEIEIETNSLAADIEQLTGRLNSTRDLLGEMYDAVLALDRTWDGPTNDVFNQQFLSDKNSMLELCDTIKSIIDCLSFAKNEYDSCENKVASIVNSIKL